MSRVILYREVRKLHSLDIYIYIFLFSCFLRDFLKKFCFAHSVIEYEWFLNRSIWPLDVPVSASTTLGQTGPGSNSNEEVLLYFDPSTQPKVPFKVMHRKEVTHSNGSYERKLCRWAWLIIWDKVKVPLQSDASKESDFWTAWQLFPLDDDQTCDSKDRVGDWVGIELLYNSVKTEVR